MRDLTAFCVSILIGFVIGITIMIILNWNWESFIFGLILCLGIAVTILQSLE